MRSIVGIGLVILLAFGAWSASKSLSFQTFGEIVTHAETDRRIVALTFDDGPSRRFTADVLGLLAQKEATATFFLTGHEASKNRDLVQDIVAGGHELGNHSFSHERMILKSPAWVRAELAQTDAVLRSGGYTGPIAFRPPYGQKFIVLPWVLAAENRPSIMWDVTPKSEDMDPQEMANDIVAQAQPGSIVLMHVMYGSRETSRAALPFVIDGLRDRGFTLVTLDALLADDG